MRKTTLAILGALVCGLLVLGASGLVAMGAAPGSGFAQEEQDAAANASPDVPAQEAAVHPGREDYVQMGCYQCHGYEGHGGGSAGPRIAPDPLAYDAFARIVRRPYGVMPAYSPRVLSDEGLKRIYEYVKSIPASPDASELPLLAGEDEGGSDVSNSS
jgi:mono/diheme cytochrome c family protein